MGNFEISNIVTYRIMAVFIVHNRAKWTYVQLNPSDSFLYPQVEKVFKNDEFIFGEDADSFHS